MIYRMKTILLITMSGGLAFSACNLSRGCAPLSGTKAVQSPSTPPGTEKNDAIEYRSEAAVKAKIYAELLREIFLVVLLDEPKDRSQFGNLVDALNQGASLEGIYNGLTHSAEYRKLETKGPKASVTALEIFLKHLDIFESELPVPTQFGSGNDNETTSSVSDIKQYFQNSSIFTLKRVAADEALKVIDFKRTERSKLVLWYSKWAVAQTSNNVDFGLALRNRSDEVFHYNWAVNASEDNLKWEILNRVHRLLNHAQNSTDHNGST
ncbi:MAG: hypothetical protein AABZ06_08540 [Bdellovibrionota bacterium]